MKQGYKVSDALFCDGQGSFYEHVRFFVKLLPLEDAIIQSVQLSAAFENIKSTLKKSAVYPCVLLLSAFVLLFFFTNAVIPTMMQTFSDMNDFKTLSIVGAACSFYMPAIRIPSSANGHCIAVSLFPQTAASSIAHEISHKTG